MAAFSSLAERQGAIICFPFLDRLTGQKQPCPHSCAIWLGTRPDGTVYYVISLPFLLSISVSLTSMFPTSRTLSMTVITARLVGILPDITALSLRKTQTYLTLGMYLLSCHRHLQSHLMYVKFPCQCCSKHATATTPPFYHIPSRCSTASIPDSVIIYTPHSPNLWSLARSSYAS